MPKSLRLSRLAHRKWGESNKKSRPPKIFKFEDGPTCIFQKSKSSIFKICARGPYASSAYQNFSQNSLRFMKTCLDVKMYIWHILLIVSWYFKFVTRKISSYGSTKVRNFCRARAQSVNRQKNDFSDTIYNERKYKIECINLTYKWNISFCIVY